MWSRGVILKGRPNNGNLGRPQNDELYSYFLLFFLEDFFVDEEEVDFLEFLLEEEYLPVFDDFLLLEEVYESL